jgi:hypothetical protein
MWHALRGGCLGALAFFWAANPAGAEKLPVGVWTVNAAGRGQGELVIQEVKQSGAVVGKAFGKTLKGKWDGTKLSFEITDVLPEQYEGWLVQEKRGKKVRYTLGGVRRIFTFYPADRSNWYEVGGWYAQLQRREKKR